MPRKLHIAIVGGSIAGCTLANGLLRHEHIIFDVFESKPTFSERGAAIALHTNALAALRGMGLDVDQLLRESHANKRDILQTIVGEGEHKGKDFLETIEGPWGAGRQQLLERLLAPLPQHRLHCNKKLLSIDNSSEGTEPLTLHFIDGTSYRADAVIGCDGLRSKVREIILGPDHPSLKPRSAGFWDARGLIPTSRAIESFGTNVVDPSKLQLTAVAGDGVFTLSGPIGDAGKMYFVTVAGSAFEGWDTTSWKKDLDRGHLERALRGWDEQYVKGVVDCIMENGPGVVFNQWESAEAPTYFRRRICIVGDAAHGTSNWMGQGAAMAIEDCSVLASLLRVAQCQEDIESSFKAYDQVRRGGGRPQEVIEQSRLLGQVLTGQLGLDPAGVAHLQMQTRRQEIASYDVQQHVNEAIEIFEKLRQ